jgi:hypothetical protein
MAAFREFFRVDEHDSVKFEFTQATDDIQDDPYLWYKLSDDKRRQLHLFPLDEVWLRTEGTMVTWKYTGLDLIGNNTVTYARLEHVAMKRKDVLVRRVCTSPMVMTLEAICSDHPTQGDMSLHVKGISPLTGNVMFHFPMPWTRKLTMRQLYDKVKDVFITEKRFFSLEQRITFIGKDNHVLTGRSMVWDPSWANKRTTKRIIRKTTMKQVALSRYFPGRVLRDA